MSEKMDFEKFNYASSISMPVTTKLPDGTTMDMKVESHRRSVSNIYTLFASFELVVDNYSDIGHAVRHGHKQYHGVRTHAVRKAR